METVEERIAEAYRLLQENVELQSEIDDNERKIEELLNIESIPYDFKEMVALLRDEEPAP